MFHAADLVLTFPWNITFAEVTKRNRKMQICVSMTNYVGRYILSTTNICVSRRLVVLLRAETLYTL